MSKSLEESIEEILRGQFVDRAYYSDGSTSWGVDKNTKKLSALFNSSLAQYKREIIKEIKDDCFEVLFTKYLEHDDAVNATDDVLAELEKI